MGKSKALLPENSFIRVIANDHSPKHYAPIGAVGKVILSVDDKHTKHGYYQVLFSEEVPHVDFGTGDFWQRKDDGSWTHFLNPRDVEAYEPNPDVESESWDE